MAITIARLEILINQYREFKAAYNTVANSLTVIKTKGGALFQNPDGSEEFPNSWGAFQTYLTNLNNVIDSFIAAIPVEPPLNEVV